MAKVWLILVLFIAVFVKQFEIQQTEAQILVENLDSILGNNDHPKATLSNNGTSIAWLEADKICIYNIAGQATICHDGDWNNGAYASYYDLNTSYLSWSHSDTHIALARDPFLLNFESDIWIVDTASGQFTNLTVDQLPANSPRNGVPVDYLPLWSPNSDDLFFFRTFMAENGFFQNLMFYQNSLSSHELKLLDDLSENFFWRVQDGAVSPDGEQIALILWDIDLEALMLRQIESDQRKGAYDGIWLLNLNTAAMQQIASPSDFMAGMPDCVSFWQAASTTSGIYWTVDGNGLVVAGIGKSQDEEQGIFSFHYIDADSGEVTPIVDMTGLAHPDVDSGSSLRENMPIYGLLSPYNSDFYYLRNWINHQAELYRVSLPVQNDEDLIGTVNFPETFTLSNQILSQITPDGKAIISNSVLLEFSQIP